jgi:hypothetical protein
MQRIVDLLRLITTEFYLEGTAITASKAGLAFRSLSHNKG